jgi:hypothetical protein
MNSNDWNALLGGLYQGYTTERERKDKLRAADMEQQRKLDYYKQTKLFDRDLDNQDFAAIDQILNQSSGINGNSNFNQPMQQQQSQPMQGQNIEQLITPQQNQQIKDTVKQISNTKVGIKDPEYGYNNTAGELKKLDPIKKDLERKINLIESARISDKIKESKLKPLYRQYKDVLSQESDYKKVLKENADEEKKYRDEINKIKRETGLKQTDEEKTYPVYKQFEIMSDRAADLKAQENVNKQNSNLKEFELKNIKAFQKAESADIELDNLIKYGVDSLNVQDEKGLSNINKKPINLTSPMTGLSLALNDTRLVPQFFKSQEYKALKGMGDKFLNTVLRDESGAAIPDTEYPKYRSYYIPEAGDDANMLKWKSNNRKLAVRGFKSGNYTAARDMADDWRMGKKVDIGSPEGMSKYVNQSTSTQSDNSTTKKIDAKSFVSGLGLT